MTTLVVPASAPGQGPMPGARQGPRFHPDASFTAESMLRNAAGHVKAGQWSEAIDLYQRVIREHGEAVTQVGKDDPAGENAAGAAAARPVASATILYLDARQNCHRRIAAMPPEARALYRRRVDADAERLYRDGLERSDPAPLRQVAEEAFCSSFGDDAVEALGDLAFRAGRFAEALGHYRRLVPDPSAPAGGLVHPDPDVALASIAAKALLCRAAVGEAPPVPAELEAYARDYPGVEGRLAGRTGSLADSLANAITQDGLATTPRAEDGWPTFAGAMSRTRIAAATVDVGSLQWKLKLDPVPQPRPMGGPMFFGGRMAPGASPTRPDRGLAFFPLVLDEQVVLCDAERIVAYNLGDRPASDPAAAAGESEVKLAWEQALPAGGLGGSGRLAYLNAPRYTATAAGDRLFARLGPPGGPRLGSSYLVAVDRKAEGKLLWRRPAGEVELPRRQGAGGRIASFEGTPVADSRNVYVGLTETGSMAAMTALYVACLDADTGATRWARFLGEATLAFDAMMGMPFADDVGNRLLTLAGGTIYYQTNLGAVVALDADTGAIRWLTTYPTVPQTGRTSQGRDLNPAIVHDGLVIVAPDDSSDILAFDAATGRPAWRTSLGDAEIVHVLGVAQGRIIATGNRVWSFDARTGKLLRYWPEGGAGFQGFGRGVLAGRYVYWPTRSEIHVLDQATGLKADDAEPIPLQAGFGVTGGNLAVGDGYLVVAGEDSLVVFCQNRRLIDRYREAIAAAPDRADNYVRLARVAEASGDDDLALSTLDQAAERLKPAEALDGRPLDEAVRRQRHRVLLRLAGKASTDGDWAAAAQRFEAAAAAAQAPRDRLAARLNQAQALERKGDPATSVALLQMILAEESLRGLTVPADDRRTVRADLLVADRLSDLLATHGRAIYEPFDRDAKDLLDRGRADADPRLLEEVGQSYPAASVATAALLALAQLHDRQEHPAEAARAYKKLLAMSPSRADEADRARALLGLGRAYEAQGYLVPARDAYAAAQSRFPTLRLSGQDATVGAIAAERLARAPFAALAGDRPEPSLPEPLGRVWVAHWPSTVRPIGAEGVPPARGAGRIFLAEGGTLRPLDPATGRYPWSADLGGDPVWVSYMADRVLAATTSRLTALDVRTGAVRWTFDAGNPNAARRAPNPFARPAPDEPRRAGDNNLAAADNEPPARLDDLRVVRGRVFARRGDRELIALDGESGQIDWAFRPAGGATLHTKFWVGPHRAVVQVRDPNATIVLDTETGRPISEFAQGENEEAWGRDPLPLDDDRVAVVVGGRHVALLDLNRGAAVWTYRESSALPRSGPPRLMGDAGRLLVLRDGSELIRLDPTTGRKLWSRLLGVEDLSEWSEALALDADRVYCATGPTLTAYNLDDGQPVWKRYLVGPRLGWALALADRSLVAYPSPARSIENDGLAELPILLVRRDTGRLVQRVRLGEPASALAVRLAPETVLVATQSSGWALGPSPVMDAAAEDR
jgi:outer membrane protein assembly factor BamB/tetratricopeptide (TPR) repeat protein